MTAYFARRLLLIVPTFIGITLMVFTITRMVPGGPLERMMSKMQQMDQSSNVGKSTNNNSNKSSALSEDQQEQLKIYYGLDRPIYISYFIWLKKVVTFDLGTSTRYNEPVWEIIKSKFHVSLTYGLLVLVISYLVSIPMGIYKALKHSSIFDNISSAFIFIGYSIPNYVIGIGLIVIFAANLDLFPMGGFASENFSDLTMFEKFADIVWHAFLPVTSYLAASFAGMTFLMKNTMMDNLSADYVRTAMAKGLSFRKAVVGHALRNSLIPIATSFGNSISVLVMGSFLVETVFNIDGFGLLGYESVVERDYPVVLGVLVISSLLFLIGNILSDICVALVDPRVQFSE